MATRPGTAPGGGCPSGDLEVLVLVWMLLACGGDDAAEPVGDGVSAAQVSVDSPFCASFEACAEGMPAWTADCQRWWAGDPDCSDMDWSKGPSDWVDQTNRGLSALRQPGHDEAAVVVDEIVEAKPQVTSKVDTKSTRTVETKKGR